MDTNFELMIATTESTGFFFVKVLTHAILKKIMKICSVLGLQDFRIHGFISTIEDSRFIQIDSKD